MSNEKIRDLLANLHTEVRKTELDDQTLASLKKLDDDLHNLLDESLPDPDMNSMMDRAKELEAEFAVRHPTAETVLREVINTLARIGI